MKIIGEKINGSRKRVKMAISNRDTEFIQDLAKRQEAAGAAWLDVNAGTHPDQEPEDLVWLVKTIQDVVDIPLCLDSANPAALTRALAAAEKIPMINSINGEEDRLRGILPLAADYECDVIALAMDGLQIPRESKDRLAVVESIMKATRAAGIPDARIYVDPLVMAVSTHIESGTIFFDTMRKVREIYPDVHFTAGLSNISFGLPARALINRTFLVLAMEAGLGSAICDPLDKDLQATIITTEMLRGKDQYCLHFTQAYRDGLLSDKEGQ
jgi:5-methyltetrahydrofolate--homocysteine methyltransferase